MLVCIGTMVSHIPFQHRDQLRVEDLFEDIKDGTKLISLLEVLSGEKLVSKD